MKTLIKRYSRQISLLMLFPLLLTGCDDMLDPTKDGSVQEEDIWGDTKYAFGFLNNAYNNLLSGYNRLDGAMLGAGSDEAIHSEPLNNIHAFNDGRWNQYLLVENVWSNCYKGIRKVNMFMERIYDVPISEKATVNGTPEEKMLTRDRMVGEAYFLRAMFYFELVKRYGGVPLITQTLSYEEAKEVSRATMAACIKQITDDCDSAYVRLPVVYDGKIRGFSDLSEIGRATTGAAMGLKARALLYWASPLHNPENDLTRWEKAAEVAKEVIDSKQYGLINFRPATSSTPKETLGNIFFISGTNFRMYNKDIVFSTQYNDSYDFEKYNTPPRLGGNGYTNPTQNLVEAFGMENGKGISENGSGYDPENPYLNRDPRFYMTILANGEEWKINDKVSVIETYEGGADATGRHETSTKTGYYLSKIMSGNAVWDGRQSKVNRTWAIIRYSEILLNYAEALNEAANSPSEEVYDALEKIRKRSGLEPYEIVRGKTKEEMREIIRNERQVELAFEEHRFFDIRRWRLYDDPVQREKLLNIRGIKIEKTGDEEYVYEDFLVEKRVFDEKMYFYPIPQSEIQTCKNLEQNPGW